MYTYTYILQFLMMLPLWAGYHNPLDLLFENSARYLLLLYTLTIFFSYIASSIKST